MAVTDADIQELRLRVSQLEKASVENTETITWVAGLLGTVKAVQDDHTRRLDRMETKVDRVEVRLDRVEVRLDRVEVRLDRVEKSVKDFREAMPGIVADAMREVLKEKR